MFRIENSRILVSGLDSQDESSLQFVWTGFLEMHSHPRVAVALAEELAMDRKKDEV